MIHHLKSDKDRNVWLDGKLLDPKVSQAVRNHSPDGFSWGYCGSGPAQLALAIMLELTGQSEGYQDLKKDFIAKLESHEPIDVKFALYDSSKIKEIVCKYCGGQVASSNPDELCQQCKTTFGHTYYSEL